MVKIKFNKGKCINPEECMKCISVCHVGALILAPANKPGNPGTPPKRYIIDLLYDVACDKCMRCVEVCPRSAIEII